MKVNPCPACGLYDSGEQWAHDPCIANTHGVTFACCGRGNPDAAYFKFSFGPTIRGTQKASLLWIRATGSGCDGKCAGIEATR